MGHIGSGRISPLGGAKSIRLANTSTDYFEVKDGDGFPIFRILGNGDLKLKGSVRKI